jgi:hypothetical protein
MSKEIASANGLKFYEDMGDRVVFTRRAFMFHPEKTYTVYREEAAKAEGIVYRPWRELVMSGSDYPEPIHEWVLTDDGYVVECFRLSKFKNKRNTWQTYLRFSFCKMFYSPSVVLSFSEWAHYGKFNRVGKRNYAMYYRNNYRIRAFVSTYVAQILTGKMDIQQLAKTISNSPATPRKSVMKMLRNEDVQKQISDEMVRYLAESEVDRDYVKGIFLEATEMARKTRNANAMIKAGEALMNLLDLKIAPKGNDMGQFPLDTKALEGIYEVLGVNEDKNPTIEEKGFVEKGRKGRKKD